jgi:ABC-type transporter Mla MlaB component
MHVERNDNTLNVTLKRDFNLYVRQQLDQMVREDDRHLILNLSACKLIDSEGVIFLHRWMAAGKTVQIIDPPPLLRRIVTELKIDQSLNWPTILAESQKPNEVL